MCDINKLKGKIVENNMTQGMLARRIAMNRSTFSRKMKKGTTFSIGEAEKIAEVLNLTKEEAMQIFLPELSHK